MFQDNMIAMLLKTNGNKSSTKKTKQARVHYFLIKYRIALGNVELKNFLQKKCYQTTSVRAIPKIQGRADEHIIIC